MTTMPNKLSWAASYARDAAHAASLACYFCIDGGFEVPVDEAVAAASNAAATARECAAAAMAALAEHASASAAEACSEESLDVAEAVEDLARAPRRDDAGWARRAGARRAHHAVFERLLVIDRAVSTARSTTT